MIPVNLRVMLAFPTLCADLCQRHEAFILINPDMLTFAPLLAQQPVAGPDKVRHPEGVLLPAASSESIVAVTGSLRRAGSNFIRLNWWFKV
ncbi:hypothetical protein HA44_01385 [Mixta gaviniae]|nr:hypothetical protein HA44_01385 [Mixta gaviniae]